MYLLADVVRTLVRAGIEIFCGSDEVVHVAERVRDNLLIDADVRVNAARRSVVFFSRAHSVDFPGEPANLLFARARLPAAAALGRGYAEAKAFVTKLRAPDDPGITLDYWYQVEFEKPVLDLEQLIEEVRFALALEKAAKPEHA